MSKELLDRALKIINQAILRGMPITDEIAEVSNLIRGVEPMGDGLRLSIVSGEVVSNATLLSYSESLYLKDGKLWYTSNMQVDGSIEPVVGLFRVVVRNPRQPMTPCVDRQVQGTVTVDGIVKVAGNVWAL